MFRFGNLTVFDNPVEIEHNGTVFVLHDFKQRMNLYQCPVIGVWDPVNRRVSHSLFGGIGNWVASADNRYLAHEPLAMSGRVTMFARDAGGPLREYLHPDPIPGGLRVGTDAVFLPHPDLEKNQQISKHGLLLLDKFPVGVKTLVGYIYGGVESFDDPATKRERQSKASSRVFEVHLMNAPGPGFQIP